jgi:NADPH-dependent 2,4-dienoyl-CoA reductase/sulfur reductase-like enzyme
MIVVVGAGPAGLAASISAAESGAKVLLVDSADHLGGQFWRHAVDDQLDSQGRDLISAVVRNSNIEILLSAQIWRATHLEGETTLHLLIHGKSREIKTKLLVLATGAYDRTLPFPGWDIPGVMTPGAAQSLLKGSGTYTGKRIVIAGTGPFLLPVASALASVGVDVVGLFEANPMRKWFRYFFIALGNPSKLLQATQYLFSLKIKGVRVERGVAVIEAHAGEDGTLESVTVAKIDRLFNIIHGTEKEILCDALAIGWGFTADLSLAGNLDLDQYMGVDGGLFVQVNKFQEASRKGIFAAGEITGIGGSELALVEGRIAGLAASGKIRILKFLVLSRYLKTKFATTLMRAYPVGKEWPRWLSEDTNICRCEEVPLSAIKEAIHNLKATDVRSTKLLCRVGMGLCQGRICGRSLIEIFSTEYGSHPTIKEQIAFASRPILSPIALEDLADS